MISLTLIYSFRASTPRLPNNVMRMVGTYYIFASLVDIYKSVTYYFDDETMLVTGLRQWICACLYFIFLFKTKNCGEKMESKARGMCNLMTKNK